ncbi:MAG: glycosyltransferase [Chloroflexi bacterium]|nr:glycosyltransferase [Chloroflexota bacterium]
MSHSLATTLVVVLEAVYTICVVTLSIYGFNSLGLVILYLFSKRPAERPQLRVKDADLPRVTIQLPIFNEQNIIERLLQAVTSQDYPRELCQIQVLDDSTDETTEIATRLVEQYRSQGWDIQIYHRSVRTGYKAGALAEGLKNATGEFVAIFDADFVPAPDWLRSVLAGFDNPKVGCVQSRWVHLNSRYNLLTNAVSLGLDAHFIVEQNARYRSDLFLGFNGSGGIWRKACIEDAGGWQIDTLTEDLDLSYRAQLKGWQIRYNPNIVVPGEVPAQVDAFKTQQYRWAKGSAQTLRKLGGTILKSDLPWQKRVMAIMHLSMYVPFPFMILTLLLTLPIALYAGHFMTLFSWTILSSLGPPLLYTIARTNHLPRFWDRLVRLPPLLMLGLGMSLNEGFAVISGIFTKGGVFNRTPKFNLRGRQGNWTQNKYALPINPVVWGELALAGYALFTVLKLWDTTMGKVIVPGMAYYALSYIMIAGSSILQRLEMQRRLQAGS